MMKVSVEARVGILMCSALVLFAGFIAVLSDFSLQPTRQYLVDFHYSGGLQIGAPVKVSGIQVGKVRSVDLLHVGAVPPAAAPRPGERGRSQVPLVRATLALNADAAALIARDTLLAIGTQGVIGEAYIEVTPRRPAGAAEALAEGGVLRGVDAPQLHVMAGQLGDLLNVSAGLFGPLARDPESVVGIGRSLAGLSERLDGFLGAEPKAMEDFIGHAAGAVQQLHELLLIGRRLLGPDGESLEAFLARGQNTMDRVEEELPDLLLHAKLSLKSLASLGQKADKAIDAGELQALSKGLQRVVGRLEQLTRESQTMMAMVRRGEGTVGGLVTDAQLYDDLKELMRDIKRHPWKVLWRD